MRVKNTISFSNLYKKRVSSFLSHLKNAQSLDEEEIHQLRVETKYIRGILRLLEIISDKRFKRDDHFNLLRPLFQEAGKVRTIDVNLELLSTFESTYFNHFFNYMKKIKAINNNCFQKEINRFPTHTFKLLNDEAQKEMNVIEPDESINKSKNFISREFKIISKLIDSYPNEEEMHKIRKELKTVKSTFIVLYGLTKDSHFKEELNKIKMVENKIGNWHDRIIFLETIKCYLQKYPNSPNLIGLNTIHHQFEAKNKKEIPQITSLLRKTILSPNN